MAPFVAELARMPLMPVSLLIPQDTVLAPPRPIRQYVQDLQNQLKALCQEVLARDEQVAERRNLIPAGSDEEWSLLPGDEVLVYAPHLSTHVDFRKHFMAWKGPFLIAKEIAEDVFEVVGMEAGVPTAYHQDKLRKYHRLDPDQPRLSPAPAPLRFVDGQVEYEIGEVLDHRDVRGRRQYLLQWKDTLEATWEWEVNMHGCVDLLRDYLQKVGESERVLPLGLTSAVPQGTGRGVSSTSRAGSTPPPSSATSPLGPLPSSSPSRRPRRRAGNRTAP